MYRFVMLLILSTLSMPVFAERTFTTTSPYYGTFNTPQAYYGGDYIPNRRYKKNRSVFSDINDLERYAMNRNFTGDSDLKRVERLETLTFGAIQEGDIYTRYDNVREAILTRPKQNYKTSILRSISDYFSGQLTGFTPSVTSNQNSNNFFSDTPYSQSSYTQYRSPWGSGYRTKDYGIGNSSGVHILD